MILTYHSLKQEPNLLSLIQAHPEKIWGLPRCMDNALSWHQWQWGDRLVPGKYGIQEPCKDAPHLLPNQVDLMWIPAVACDRHFYRLGYGGGYFDRLFGQSEWRSVFRVGITFESTYLPALPHDSWDQPLDAVCTEARFEVAHSQRGGNDNATCP